MASRRALISMRGAGNFCVAVKISTHGERIPPRSDLFNILLLVLFNKYMVGTDCGLVEQFLIYNGMIVRGDDLSTG